jgi:CysZ protein
MIKQFVTGLAYPLRALSLLAGKPGLWRYVLIPIQLNIVIGVTIYAGLLIAGLSAIDAFVAGLPSWAGFLSVVLRVLLIVGLLFGTGFVLVRIGVVFGSPWYSKLSNQLELLQNGQPLPEDSGGLSAGLRDLGRALAFELKKLLLVVAIGLAVLLLNLIPVVGQALAFVGGIALGATISCLDFFDYPLERRRLGFRQKLRLIRRSLPASAGFGLTCFGLVSIPFVNLLSIPLCVAAGTLFFCDRLVAVDAGLRRAPGEVAA